VLSLVPLGEPLDVVVGANLCDRDTSEVKGKEKRGVTGAACKVARTVHTVYIISQTQNFVVRRRISYVRSVFGLLNTCICFSFTRKLLK
jgi:hypothetical protein